MRCNSTLWFVLGLMGYLFTPQALASEELEPYYLQRGTDDSRTASVTGAVDTIDPFTGAVQLSHNDLVAAGEGGMNIAINRHYRSLSRPNSDANFRGERSPLGVGWIMHFGRVITPANASNCNTNQGDSNARLNSVWEGADGSAAALLPATSNWGHDLITKNLWVANCITGGYQIIAPNGTRYTADHYVIKDNRKYHYVTRIENKAGHYLEIEYGKSGNSGTGDGRVDRAYALSETANGYRDLIREVRSYYAGSTSVVNDVEFYYRDVNSWHARLSHIRFDNVNIVEYEYEPNSAYHYLLSKVTQQNRTNDDMVWDYNYETSPTTVGYLSLKRYETPGNARIDFDYQVTDFRTGTSSLFETITIDRRILHTSGGVQDGGIWTYDFSQNSSRDQTTVSLPNGDKIEYEHVGSDNYDSGEIWNVGSLLEVRYYDGSSLTRTESYNWEAGAKLSTQDEFHLYRATRGAEDHWSKRLASKTITLDGTSYTTTYSSFDEFNNPKRIVESGNNSRARTVSYFNSSTNWIIGVPEDENWDNEADIERDFYSSGSLGDMGYLRSETVFGVTTTYDYYSTGRGRGLVKSVDGPLPADTITYSDYYRGVARSESHPESTSISKTVDGDTGDILSVTNQRGRTTEYDYDRFGNIITITTPKSDDSNASVVSDYGSNGKTVTTTRGGHTEFSHYDGLGRLLSITKSAAGVQDIRKDYQYDALGRMTYESDDYYVGQASFGRSYRYDVADRLERVTFDADNFFIDYDYLSGNRVRVTKTANTTQVVTNTYRSYGDPSDKHLIKTSQNGTSAGSSVTIETEIGRDIFGNMTSVSQGGKTRIYKLDSRKFIDYIDNPETGRTDLYFDDAGNLRSSRVGISSATQFSYDDLNRLTTINYPGTTADVVYDYYPDGTTRYVETRAPSGVQNRWDYDWDANNNLAYERLSVDGNTYEFSYHYNGLDHLTSIDYPRIQEDSLTVTYAPDGFGRPTQAGSWVTDIDYAASGAVERTVYSNGYTNHFNRDDRQHPHLWQAYRGSQTAMEYDYDFNKLGNLERISGDSANWTFDYDSFNRLTHMNNSVMARYDQRGNITYKNIKGKTVNYNYDSNSDRLSSVNGDVNKSFSYDDYGNITGNGSQYFIYDDASNLTLVNGQIRYQYDGHKRRIKTVKDDLTTLSAYTMDGKLRMELEPGRDATQYIYAAGQLVVKRDLEGQYPPPPPTNIELSISQSTITVNWDEVEHDPEVTHYTVKYKRNEEDEYTHIIVRGMTTATIDNLVNGIVYDITISASNEIGESENSQVLSGTPLLDPVQNFKLVSMDIQEMTTDMTFSWVSNPLAQGNLFCSRNAEPDVQFVCRDIGNVDSHTYQAGAGSSIPIISTYEFYVVPYDDIARGVASQTLSVPLFQGEADIKVTLREDSEFNTSTRRYGFTAIIENLGPDTAKDMQLEIEYPTDASLSVVSVAPSQGICPPEGRTCSIGYIYSGQQVTISVVVSKAEKGDAVHTASATSTAGTPDPNLENNTIQGEFGGSLGWFFVIITGLAAYTRHSLIGRDVA